MIFDPNVGDARIVTLVASVGSERDAQNAAASYEREWIDLERERELRSIRATMHQRTGVCG